MDELSPWEIVQAKHLFKDIAENIEYVEDGFEPDLKNEFDYGIINKPCESQIAASSER